MSITFIKLSMRASLSRRLSNVAVLKVNNWDDFGFKTTFELRVYDQEGEEIVIGDVKVSYKGQSGGWTEQSLPETFIGLGEGFFSVGQDVSYYQALIGNLSGEQVREILGALGDVALLPERRKMAESESGYRTSLLRNVDQATIEDQYARVLRGEAALTPYNFSFKKERGDRSAELQLDFNVIPNSKPSTNVHVLIGRNGVGKTTILNSMVNALTSTDEERLESGYFLRHTYWQNNLPMSGKEFSGVASVSFSAFDPFEPPPDNDDAEQGVRYRYIGLRMNEKKEQGSRWCLKSREQLFTDLIESLNLCLALKGKRDRWISAIRKLESDENFQEMDLLHLIDICEKDWSEDKSSFKSYCVQFFNRISSGHAIVLLTVTQLVETVEEKTLVLIDEPEGHLHPPLLSAFTRALSDLLTNRNAVAIIATHSPVVLQEVPKSCVSIVNRYRLVATVDRPDEETFGENVGTLTRHVFGLEVNKSGFHDLLSDAVAQGMSYEQIEGLYSGQIGYEGKAIIRALIAARDRVEGGSV